MLILGAVMCGINPVMGMINTAMTDCLNAMGGTSKVLLGAIVGTTGFTKATIVPLLVAAFPFVARLVETSLRELDEGVVEAAQSMGATPFQIITKVLIPELSLIHIFASRRAIWVSVVILVGIRFRIRISSGRMCWARAVSYTHLDVYKRQAFFVKMVLAAFLTAGVSCYIRLDWKSWAVTFSFYPSDPSRDPA